MSSPSSVIVYAGSHSHRLDSRNRVAVPSQWRVPGDDGNYYFAWGHQDGFIEVYPPDMLQELLDASKAVKRSDKMGQTLIRRIFSNGHYFGCDSQGRILLPKKLLTHAGIEKEVVLVGAGRNFQLWNPEQHQAEEEEDFDMLNAMKELGF
jgi:MraZ protein